MKVLIVEDDALLALDVVKTLERNGFDVMGPYLSAETALRASAKERPDFAVIDFKLAGYMDGLALARELARYQIASIIASAYDDVTDAAQGTAFGFMAKPYRPNELMAAIRLALRYQRGEPVGDSPERFRLL